MSKAWRTSHDRPTPQLSRTRCIPGQGTKQRDQKLKAKQKSDSHLKEIHHKMISTPVDTCNTCSHDLPPEDVEYAQRWKMFPSQLTRMSRYSQATRRPWSSVRYSQLRDWSSWSLTEEGGHRCWPCLMPSVNMTNRYNNAELKKDALTSKRRQMKVGRYVIYNTGEDPVFIQKGETLGYCSLIYQDTKEDYFNEMSHMAKEAEVDKEEWKDLKTKSKRKPTSQLGGHKPVLSTDWIKDAFKLSDNATLKDKPELMNRLIKVLAMYPDAPVTYQNLHKRSSTWRRTGNLTHSPIGPTTDQTREDLPHGGGADMYEPCVLTKQSPGGMGEAPNPGDSQF